MLSAIKEKRKKRKSHKSIRVLHAVNSTSYKSVCLKKFWSEGKTPELPKYQAMSLNLACLWSELIANPKWVCSWKQIALVLLVLYFAYFTCCWEFCFLISAFWVHSTSYVFHFFRLVINLLTFFYPHMTFSIDWVWNDFQYWLGVKYQGISENVLTTVSVWAHKVHAIVSTVSEPLKSSQILSLKWSMMPEVT